MGLLSTKIAQTLPKILQNNFEKGPIMTFLAMEMAKITISGGQILTKNLDFRGRAYRPLKVKIHAKVGPRKPKTMPEPT